MRRNVLVPFDGSAFSRRIVPVICHLLDPQQYRLTLLRVADLPGGIIGAPPRTIAAAWPVLDYETPQDAEYTRHPIYSTQIEQNLRAEIEATLLDERHRLETAGYVVTTDVCFGEPAEEIVQAVRTERFEMVAMTTHGRTGLSYTLFGSVAEQVLRNAGVPVLLVRPHSGRPEPALATPRTIVVALDGSPFAEQALGPAQELAANTGAELLLVAAVPVEVDSGLVVAGLPYYTLPDERAEQAWFAGYLSNLAERLSAQGFQVRTRVSIDRPDVGILHISAVERADLIVMATHGRSGLSRLLIGSVAAGVVHGSEMPVLLIRPHERPTVSARDHHEKRQLLEQELVS